MKSLLLIRHAKSDWTNDLPDIDRPLNKRGQKDAPLMAKRLIKQKLSPQLLISSPANRAWSTANAFATELVYPTAQIRSEAAIYEATIATLLKIINTVDDQYNSVALFGHNPGISLFAHYLCDEFMIDMPTAAIVHLAVDTEHWSEISVNTAKLGWYSYPKFV